MVWTVIPDSDIDPDSPITTGLMTGYRDNIIESAPTSLILLWPLATAPSGYLECDGSSLSRTTYAVLYAVLGIAYGNVDGNTFNIPDYRGEFPRFWDHGAAIDPDRAARTDRGDATTGDNVGTKQDHQLDSHVHTHVTKGTTGSGSTYNSESMDGTPTYRSTTATGGNETRGRNVNLMPCIRYTGN